MEYIQKSRISWFQVKNEKLSWGICTKEVSKSLHKNVESHRVDKAKRAKKVVCQEQDYKLLLFIILGKNFSTGHLHEMSATPEKAHLRSDV